jgi:hypothetical protein
MKYVCVARRTIRVWSLALLLAGCAAPLPTVPPPGMPAAVPAPEIRVGDAWTYQVRDGFTGIARGEQRHEVIAVDSDRIRVAGTVERGDGMQIYDHAWNWLRRPATNLQLFEYSPAYQAFAFPLEAGKRWRARLTAIDPADGRRFPVWIDGVVAGWERISVPGGEFDAVRVERAVYFEYWEYAVRGRSEISEVEWYAPLAKQSVRREMRSRYYRLITENEYEMPEFVRVRASRSGAGGGRGSARARGGRDDGGPRYVDDDWLIYELVSYSVR